MQTTSELLSKARKYLAKGFCKNALARDAKGVMIDPRSPKAVEWCALGALSAAEPAENTWSPTWTDAQQWLDAVIGGDKDESYDIVRYNNDPKRTKAQMLDAFDAAAFMAQLNEQANIETAIGVSVNQ